jgi:hypothetical protein
VAYDAGLSPAEVRDASFGELQAVAESWMRRERRAHEARAWVVAHLMWVTGNLPRGTQVGSLMRTLLGRAEAEPERHATEELSPEASVAYMQAWTARVAPTERT